MAGICGNSFDKLFSNMAFGLSEKKTTVKHTCSKCGNVDEEPAEVTEKSLNFGTPGSSLVTKCPWK